MDLSYLFVLGPFVCAIGWTLIILTLLGDGPPSSGS
jgi:hypothetical protein